MIDGDTIREKFEIIGDIKCWSIWIALGGTLQPVYLQWSSEELLSDHYIQMICNASLKKTYRDHGISGIALFEFQEKLEINFYKMLENPPDLYNDGGCKCECGGSKLKLPHSIWCPLSD